MSLVAIIHQATLAPSKLDLVARWLPEQPWGAGQVGALRQVERFRFDDPAGEVGIEVILARAGDGPILQVPLTYRAAPLAGAEAALLGTMEHSVLGTRWTYDGCQDPVALSAMLAAIRTGGREADLDVAQADGTTQRRPSPTHVRGSGTALSSAPATAASARSDATATVVDCGDARLAVARVLGQPFPVAEGAVLTGTWPGQDDPIALMTIR
ncbi:MAG: hypothetical protein LBQ06_01035 [Frankiaceae bacterium]|nr:hypothetical protein [Frankiaceae bacterium]